MAYPILAAKNTWWAPTVSSVTRASITEIEIMDSYTPDASVTVVDSWDASAAKDGSITCYVIGSKLIIAGNGSGKIAANENSANCFGNFRIDGRFSNITTFSRADLLDTSNVTNMNSMFMACAKLKTIDVSNWDTAKVEKMNQMFAMCTNLTSINRLDDWNMSSVSNISAMFTDCPNLTSLGDLSNWTINNVTDIWGMFSGCSKLISIGDISNWNVSNASSLNSIFENCSKLTTLNVSNWNVSNITTMKRMFIDCTSLTSIGDISKWDTSNVTDMSFMFYGCSSLKEIDVSKWNVSKVTILDHFAAHAGLRRKGIENWKTTSLVNANAAFHNCAEEELDLSGWDVSKVQFFCQMFENSPNLKRIKGLEKWNTSAGLGFDGMFERCAKLEELDLSSFDTSKAKNGVEGSANGHKTATLNNMFLSCNNLKKVKVGPNFSINGDGSNTTAANKAILPTPSTDYIEGADGMWYAFNGEPHAPNAIKDKTAETYFASYALCADQDIIVKNGSMIDAAKAIREKNSATDHYTPAQFGAAIRALN